VELNSFFLKHVFNIGSSHPLVIGRLLLISVISAPSIRQFYGYVTDAQCKRLGTQCWVFIAVTLTETLLCIKFGYVMFRETQIRYVAIWLAFQMVVCITCVYFCARLAKHEEDIQIKKRKESREEESAELSIDGTGVEENPVLPSGDKTDTTHVSNGTQSRLRNRQSNGISAK